MEWWKRILAGVLLVAFLAIKGAFWLALIPHNSSDKPTPVHACACTGEPVCRCGPGGCCGGEPAATDPPDFGDAQIHPPKLCGSLSQGAGPLAEIPCLECVPWNWHPLVSPGVWGVFVSDSIQSQGSRDPDPPVPKT